MALSWWPRLSTAWMPCQVLPTVLRRLLDNQDAVFMLNALITDMFDGSSSGDDAGLPPPASCRWPLVTRLARVELPLRRSPDAATVTGTFDTVEFDANQPNQLGVIEVCFTAQNCPGGGSGGVTQGNTGSGTFTLSFSEVLTSIELTSFFIRWQSIEGVAGVGSASGVPGTCPPTNPNCPPGRGRSRARHAGAGRHRRLGPRAASSPRRLKQQVPSCGRAGCSRPFCWGRGASSRIRRPR